MTKQSKNILIITHHYPPHITGVGFVAQNQAKRLAALGHKITVITSKTNAQENSCFVDGVQVVCIKALNFSEKWGAPFPIFSPTLLFSLFRYVRRADVVHIHDVFYMSSWWAALLARLYGKPIVLTQHVAMIAHPSRIIVAIQKIVYATAGAVLFRFSDRILTYNERVEQFLVSRGVARRKLFVLANGVDTEYFHSVVDSEKKALRQRFGFHPHKKIILFVGRFVPKKGLDKVLAVRDLEYQIICAGGNPPKETFDNVIFLGKLSQETLAEVYRAADVFLLPSESEGFPLSIQEAMASGLPIVATNDDGYKRYHFDDNLICFIDDPSEIPLRKALQGVIRNETLLRAMGAYSREYAQNNFGWTAIISQLNGIYNDLSFPSKKIAFVSDAVYPFNKGGKEKRIYDITTRLAAQGYAVTIYCMNWWGGEKTIVRDGVTFHAISPYYPLYAGNRRSIKEAVFFALHCFKMLTKKFDVVEIDVVPHIPLFTMKLICLLKSKKMFVTWHEVWGLAYWREYLGFGGYIAYLIERMTVKLPNAIIAVSEHTAESLRDKLRAKQEIVVIRNGLDIAEILSNPPADKGADIIFAGRLLAHKNVDVLLHAMKILIKDNPDMSLFIIGDGPERENLEGLADNLGIKKNVSFFGFLEDQNELYRIMHASRVFVLPSTREGFGIVAIEANACGLPVVTIDHEQNATKELIVSGENGLLSSLDKAELAKTIQISLRMKKDRTRYRQYVEKYNWQYIVEELQRAYSL